MSNREFTATRTMLANAFATAGAELLEYMGTAAALAAIPNTDPPQYVVAGTLAMIGKVLPNADVSAAATVLTDERIKEIGLAIGIDAFEAEQYRASQCSGLTAPEQKAYAAQIDFARAIESEALAHAGKAVAADESVELQRIAEYWEDQARRGCVDAFQCALREAWNVASRAHAGVTAEPAALAQTTEPVNVRALVNRFLGWKLPKDFSPDSGISFTPYPDPLLWPIGTNLFNDDQAKAMFEHCLNGAVRPTDDDLWDQTLRDRETYREWADKLSEAIAKHFGAELGEHSNMNCPWAEALEVIESAQVPAAEVRAAEWQPIATVPMDGSEVLLYLPAPYNRVVKARWFDIWENWIEGEFPDPHDEYCGIGSLLPTYWMNLPAAPSTADSAGTGAMGEGAEA